jgi:hypothetical protein
VVLAKIIYGYGGGAGTGGVGNSGARGGCRQMERNWTIGLLAKCEHARNCTLGGLIPAWLA